MPRDITASVVRNIFILRQLENGLTREQRRRILDIFDDLIGALTRRDLDPTVVGPRFRDARFEKLIAEFSQRLGTDLNELRKWLRGALAGLGVQQAAFGESVLKRAVDGIGVSISADAVGVNFFKRLIDAEPIDGFLYDEWFSVLGDRTLARLNRTLRTGLVQNETIDQLIRRIRGRAAGGGPRPTFVGGVMNTTTREAAAIARTAVNHLANSAHMEVYGQNADILAGVEWTAAFDSRTCPICGALDGEVWKLDDERLRRPPAHVNCRCVLVPVVDWQGLGVDPPSGGRRASADGPVDSDLTFEQWLKGQSAGFQNEVLGPSRARLFRAGKIDLRELVTRDGRTKRLDELAA